MKREIKYLDLPPGGWFVLDVMRTSARKWDWCALMIDVHPDDFVSYCSKEHRSAWVRIKGKHRNRDAAYDVLAAALIATPAVSEALQ